MAFVAAAPAEAPVFLRRFRSACAVCAIRMTDMATHDVHVVEALKFGSFGAVMRMTATFDSRRLHGGALSLRKASTNKVK